MDFHEIFSKGCTWGKEQYFRDVAFNPLNTGLNFIFSGFVIVGNIMKKRAHECFLFDIMDFYKGIYIVYLILFLIHFIKFVQRWI